MADDRLTYRGIDGLNHAVRFDDRAPGRLTSTISAIVDRGQGLASGRNQKYGASTVALQYPHFLERGLDIGMFYPGTLNLSIAPRVLALNSPSRSLVEVKWHEDRIPETFHFADCSLAKGQHIVDGLIYYPDPATKAGDNPDNPSHIQVLSPFLPDCEYGAAVTVHYDPNEVQIIESNS